MNSWCFSPPPPTTTDENASESSGFQVQTAPVWKGRRESFRWHFSLLSLEFPAPILWAATRVGWPGGCVSRFGKYERRLLKSSSRHRFSPFSALSRQTLATTRLMRRRKRFTIARVCQLALIVCCLFSLENEVALLRVARCKQNGYGDGGDCGGAIN